MLKFLGIIYIGGFVMAKTLNIRKEQEKRMIYNYFEDIVQNTDEEALDKIALERQNLELSWIEKYGIKNTDKDICLKALELLKENLKENPLDNEDYIDAIIHVPLNRLINLSYGGREISTPFHDKLKPYIECLEPEYYIENYKFVYDNQDEMFDEIREAFIKNDKNLYANAMSFLLNLSTINYILLVENEIEKRNEIEKSQH